MTPVLVCDGWHITTVEGIGNYKEGLHPIQERLADFHGTQCGYCTPGMVMQMNRYHVWCKARVCTSIIDVKIFDTYITINI